MYTQTQKVDYVRHRERMAIRKPRSEASGESTPANALVWNCQPPELRENKLPLVKPSTPRCIVVTALGNEYGLQEGAQMNH